MLLCAYRDLFTASPEKVLLHPYGTDFLSSYQNLILRLFLEIYTPLKKANTQVPAFLIPLNPSVQVADEPLHTGALGAGKFRIGLQTTLPDIHAFVLLLFTDSNAHHRLMASQTKKLTPNTHTKYVSIPTN